MWTYERTIFGGQPFRAFVWMQGHTYTNFKNPQIEGMLLRAIAWAGHYPVDSLVNGAPPARTGGRAGAGRVAPMRPRPPAGAAEGNNGKHDADPPEQPVGDGRRSK